MNNRTIQRKDQAGHTKLTAVTIGYSFSKRAYLRDIRRLG